MDGLPRDLLESATREELIAEIERLRSDRGTPNGSRSAQEGLGTFIENTSDALFCYEYHPPIPTDLPVEEQIRLLYDEVLVECNENYVRFMGFESRDAVVGKKLTEIMPGLEPGGPIDELFRAYIEGGYRTVDELGQDRYPDGSMRYTLHNTVGEVVDGRLVRSWGAFHDITEFRALEDALQAGRRFESLGRVSKGIAHDFNNLLTEIMMRCELAAGQIGADGDEGLKKILGDIQNVTDRGRDLVGRIEEFSKERDDDATFVQLQPVIVSMVELLKPSLLRFADVRLDVDENCGPARGRPVEVERVLMNLVTNAVRATQGMIPEISVSLRQEEVAAPRGPLEVGRYACLTVGDNGCGIPPEHLDLIFEPYFSTHEDGDGTGWGLAVVHGVVRESGGQIEVASTVGEGTTMSVYLPLAEEPTAVPTA